jgi:hypothetical protein
MLSATRASSVLVAAWLLGLCATPALAQPTAAIDGRAHVIFESGRDAYDHGRYLEASEAFERVFALTGHPYMLRNLGNCYAKLGQDAKAAAALHQYLLLEPSTAERAEIEARIVALQAPARSPVVAPAVRADTSNPPRHTFTWIALGAGALSAALATGLWIDANRRFDSLARGCGAHGGCSASQTDAVSARVTATNVVTAVCVSALVAASVLWFVEPSSAPAVERVQLVSRVGRSGAALLLQGRF